MNTYESAEKILDLVRRFEAYTISRGEWKHAEHLIVALYYSVNHDLVTATEKMRGGLLRLLEAFGVDLTKEMPYHETLTVFWMRTVYAFAMMRKETPLAETAAELVATFDKDYPLRFYSRERLFSDEARTRFIEEETPSPQTCPNKPVTVPNDPR